MDTIDASVLQDVAERLRVLCYTQSLPTIDTVTITLNGQHGGVDFRIQGEDIDMTYRVAR